MLDLFAAYLYVAGAFITTSVLYAMKEDYEFHTWRVILCVAVWPIIPPAMLVVKLWEAVRERFA